MPLPIQLPATIHANTLNTPANSEMASLIESNPYLLNIDGTNHRSAKPNQSNINSRKVLATTNDKEATATENILQGGVLNHLFRDDILQSGTDYSKQQNQKQDYQSVEEKQDTENICYCSKNDPKSHCKLPDIFRPEKPSKRKIKTKHIADNKLTPENIRRIGIEIETSNLTFLNTTEWSKGQILSRTTGECFGYPLISITAERSADGKACPELVTAPLTEDQIHHFKINQKIKKLQELLTDFSENQCYLKFQNVVLAYNEFIENSDPERLSINIMCMSSLNQHLPYKGKIKIDRAPVSLKTQENIGDTLIIKDKETPIYWYYQHNFFMPYSRISLLCSAFIKENGAEKVINTPSMLDEIANLTAKLNTLFLDVPGFDDIDKIELTAFLTNHLYTAANYFYRLSNRENCDMNYLNQIRFNPLSTRISLHQEIFEILSDQTVKPFNNIGQTNKRYEISATILTELLTNSRTYFKNNKMLIIFSTWLAGYWQDLFECAKLRVEHGSKKVIDANTENPFIMAGEKKIPLPLNAATATEKIIDKFSYHKFIMEPVKFGEECWVVMELRKNIPIQQPLVFKATRPSPQLADDSINAPTTLEEAEQLKYIPFNNSDWMEEKPPAEQHFMNIIWGTV